MDAFTLTENWIWIFLLLVLLIGIIGGLIGGRGRPSRGRIGREGDMPARFANEFYRAHTNEILRLAGADFRIGAQDECGLDEIIHAESLLLMRIVERLDPSYRPDSELFREIGDQATRRHRRDEELDRAERSRWMSLGKTLLKKVNPIVTKVVGKWFGTGDE